MTPKVLALDHTWIRTKQYGYARAIGAYPQRRSSVVVVTTCVVKGTEHAPHLPQHNAAFRRTPTDPDKAFVPLGDVDLDSILCQEDARVVAPDNTVVVGDHLLQIDRQPGRRTCAGLRVLVRQHLDGRLTITRPPDVPLTYTVVTKGAVPPVPPPVVTKKASTRSRRKTGLGRWPKTTPWVSRFPEGTDHVSNR